ncbi:MAG: hypothetical protein MUF01_19065 [Bryobacterales bacterium]|nr:hypothetical protein [Bryobacterales bacterium]
MAIPPPPLPKLRWFDKAYLVVMGAYLLLSLVVETGFPGALAGFLLVIIGLGLGLRYVRIVGKQLLWPLRNRLRVTYMFIGVVPILLILLLVAIGAYILTGQIASFLLTTELQRRAALLAAPSPSSASSPSLSSNSPGCCCARSLATNAGPIRPTPPVPSPLPGGNAPAAW